MNCQLVRKQMMDLIRLRHLSLSTERCYLGWFDQYCSWLRAAPRAGSSSEKVGAFLSHLAQVRTVSASTQNQAFNALLFLYRETLQVTLENIQSMRAKKGERVRHAPSVDEVRKLLGAVQDRNGYPIRLIVGLLYGCGLRVNEPLNLRIKDLKLSESQLIIHEAKGRKDRVVAIPCSLVPALQRQIERARLIWQEDQASGLPVTMPDALARKYPRAARSWSWFWLFPLRNPCEHPRSKEMVRWHCLDVTVQRAVRDAVRRENLDCMITPHVLRHAYATHALNAGTNVRSLQVAMGHSSLETTMGYLHADATSVRSPLDLMVA